MRNAPPIRDAWGSPPCANWLQQVFAALSGWNQTRAASATIDFPSVAAQSRASAVVAVKKACIGDVVAISPSSGAAGMIYTADVTANDTVTVYANNYSAGAINPPSTDFRVIVFQGA